MADDAPRSHPDTPARQIPTLLSPDARPRLRLRGRGDPPLSRHPTAMKDDGPGAGPGSTLTAAAGGPREQEVQEEGLHRRLDQTHLPQGEEEGQAAAQGQTLLGGTATGSRPKPSAAGAEEFLSSRRPPRRRSLRRTRRPSRASSPASFKSEGSSSPEGPASPPAAPRATAWCAHPRGGRGGAWYFEIKVGTPRPHGHPPPGWATNRADPPDGPSGMPRLGLAYRDMTGPRWHKAWREKYADEGYGEEMSFGFYISLPDGSIMSPSNLI
ncbi:hypothetical protein EJB05_29569, partial [Eragrostis curvula]